MECTYILFFYFDMLIDLYILYLFYKNTRHYTLSWITNMLTVSICTFCNVESLYIYIYIAFCILQELI